jgi:hypothetical protein
MHHREMIVNDYKLKLMRCLQELCENLTTGEFVRVVSEELSDQLGGVAKYMIREERHPDNISMPGGLELQDK